MTQSDQDNEHGDYDGGVLDDISGYLLVGDVMDAFWTERTGIWAILRRNRQKVWQRIWIMMTEHMGALMYI